MNLEILLEKAQNVIRGDGAQTFEAFEDPAQYLAETGLNLEALSSLAPETIIGRLESDGLRPSPADDAALLSISGARCGADIRS